MVEQTPRHGFDTAYEDGDEWDYNDEFEALDELVNRRGTFAERPETGEYPDEMYEAVDRQIIYRWDADAGEWDSFAGQGVEGSPLPGTTYREEVHTDQLTIRFDPDGSDYTDLQAVIDDAPTGARIVGHKQSTIPVDEPSALDLGLDGVTVENLKFAATDTFGPAGGYTPVVGVTGADDVTLRNIEIDGNRANNDSAPFTNLLAEDVSGLTIDGLKTHSCTRHALFVTNEGFAWEDDRNDEINIRNVETWNYGDDGITLHYVDGATVEKWYAHDNDNYTGGARGVEIEEGSRNIVVEDGSGINCGLDAVVVTNGSSEPNQNVTVRDVVSIGNRDGFSFLIENTPSADRDPTGHVLENCHSRLSTRRPINVHSVDLDVYGGTFLDADHSWSVDISDPEGYHAPEVNFHGHGVLSGGRINYDDGATGYVGPWEVTGYAWALFARGQTGPIKVDGLKGDGGVQAQDSASEIYFENLDIDGDIITQDSATAYVRDCSTSGFDEIGGTLVVRSHDDPIDVTALTPAVNAQAYHDGTSGPEGPAFGDGEKWISLLNGEVIN